MLNTFLFLPFLTLKTLDREYIYLHFSSRFQSTVRTLIPTSNIPNSIIFIKIKINFKFLTNILLSLILTS